MSVFLEEIPTLFVESELKRLRHQGSQRPWEVNDLLDIAALAPAVVHCDVVVTERSWARLIEQEGLAERFNTKVVWQPDEVADALLAV